MSVPAFGSRLSTSDQSCVIYNGCCFVVRLQSMPMPKKPRSRCLMCNTYVARPTYKYCTNACQHEYQNQIYLEKWRAGKVSGLQSIGIVSPWVKRYLRQKFGDRCVLCGWSQINVKTGKVPLVADHIDGNWKNNKEENLRLVCPNCDALSPTFSALNKGNGRKGRAVSKRTLEAQKLSRMQKSNLVVI